jgi:hypothetical protein
MKNAFAALGLLWATGASAVEVGWSGAARIGVGGALTGPRAGVGNIDLGFRFDVMLRKASPFDAWGAGPYVDFRTLAFQRHDALVGVAVVSPVLLRFVAAGIRSGVGYRWASDADKAGVFSTTVTFSLRVPVKGHEEAILGVYVDGRVLLESGGASELTTGFEIDPIGLIAALSEKPAAPPPRTPPPITPPD